MRNELLDTMFGMIDLNDYVQESSAGEVLTSDALKKLCQSKESRLKFAACSEMRKRNIISEDIQPKEMLGVVMEVAVDTVKVDRVAVYSDGRARYLGFDGKMLIWEQHFFQIEKLIADIISKAEKIFIDVNDLEDRVRQNIKKGDIRITALTSEGYKVLEGEFASVAQVNQNQDFIKTMMQLIQMLKQVSGSK